MKLIYGGCKPQFYYFVSFNKIVKATRLFIFFVCSVFFYIIEIFVSMRYGFGIIMSLVIIIS